MEHFIIIVIKIEVYLEWSVPYLSGDGGDKIGMALRLASERSSVQLATPDILKVTFSLIIVSFRVGVEIARNIEERKAFGLAPFNYDKNVNKCFPISYLILPY